MKHQNNTDKLIKLAFKFLDPSFIYEIVLLLIKYDLLKIDPIKIPTSSLSQTFFGMGFKHPIGLAAGFDRNASCYKALLNKFSFLEVGTVTPKSQKSKYYPKIAMIERDAAVLHAYGFMNYGIEYIKNNIKHRSKNEIIGVNIGSSSEINLSPHEYLDCMMRLYKYASYITLNISNYFGAEAYFAELKHLLSEIAILRADLNSLYRNYKPIFLKIHADIQKSDLERLCEIIALNKIEGVVFGCGMLSAFKSVEYNTIYKNQINISGRAIFDKVLESIAYLYKISNGSIFIIGAGGIFSAEDVYKMIANGASLVQLYSAVLYNGFGVVDNIVESLDLMLKENQMSNISELIGKAVI